MWGDDMNRPSGPTRRELVASAMAGTAWAALGFPAAAQNQPTVGFTAWSAAVDQVRAHITAFEKSSGLKVRYESFPSAQIRSSVVAQFAAGAPLDVVWMLDAWTPEFVQAGWIAPIDDIPELAKYTPETIPYCIDAMSYKGRQYGLSYYTDFMAFLYNRELLERAGFDKPPSTWDELVEQSLAAKKKGVADFPLMLALSADTWLTEMFSTLVYSFGGRLVAPDGKALMADPERGAVAALSFTTDAIHKHKIVSPGAVETNEINGLKAMGAGKHLFALLPRYRIRNLNDPAQAQTPNQIRVGMMPKGGPRGTGETCGWVRYFGMSADAKKDPARRARAAKLIEWFGGKADQGYVFQKILLLDLGVPYCSTPLDSDPEVKAFYDRWAGGYDTIGRQSQLVVKKDVISPWFGEWSEANNQLVQTALLGKSTPAEAMKATSDKWNELKAAH